MKIEFTKMHGCGNDYVYIDGARFNIPKDKKPELVKALSDRHFGIGSDGVIFINPSKDADFEMEMYNADGSRSEMCGNGIRCVAKYVYDHALTDKNVIDIESFGKIKHITVDIKDSKVVGALVDMGEPILTPALIPLNMDMVDGGLSVYRMKKISALSKDYRITCVSMGNPHGVVYVDDVENIDIDVIGPILENHPLFPKKANIEFVENVDETHIKMRVWERGTGETLACGTGCCALTVAGVLNGFNRINTEIEIKVLGGIIKTRFGSDNHVYMEGEAKTVFEGEIEWQV